MKKWCFFFSVADTAQLAMVGKKEWEGKRSSLSLSLTLALSLYSKPFVAYKTPSPSLLSSVARFRFPRKSPAPLLPGGASVHRSTASILLSIGFALCLHFSSLKAVERFLSFHCSFLNRIETFDREIEDRLDFPFCYLSLVIGGRISSEVHCRIVMFLRSASGTCFRVSFASFTSLHVLSFTGDFDVVCMEFTGLATCELM